MLISNFSLKEHRSIFTVKGIINHHLKHPPGEPLYKFSVVVKGKAVLYMPRKYADEVNTTKQELIKIYTEVIRQELFPRSRKLREAKPIKDEEDMLVARKRITKIIHETINQKLNEGLGPVIERIMSAKDIQHITSLKNSDLSPEEKLFLLANITDADDYIRHGDFDTKNVGHLNVGGTISDINLLQMGLSEYTVVAEDDLYLASFTRDEYSKGFTTAASENLNEKIEFIAKLFPSLAKDSRRKIAFFLEERQFNKGGIIYKKGSEAEEFYMIKDGEIEVLPLRITTFLSHSCSLKRRRGHQCHEAVRMKSTLKEN